MQHPNHSRRSGRTGQLLLGSQADQLGHHKVAVPAARKEKRSIVSSSGTSFAIRVLPVHCAVHEQLVPSIFQVAQLPQQSATGKDTCACKMFRNTQNTLTGSCSAPAAVRLCTMAAHMHEQRTVTYENTHSRALAQFQQLGLQLLQDDRPLCTSCGAEGKLQGYLNNNRGKWETAGAVAICAAAQC